METLATAHPKLTTDEARALTNEIRTDMFGLPQKILRAHDGEVWTALGYATFKEWAEKEYPHGIRRVYQLLNYARVERTIGSLELTNERQARLLAPLPDEQKREVFASATEAAKAEGKPLTARHIEVEVERIGPSKPKPKRNGAASVEPPPHAPGQISDAELDEGDKGDPVWLNCHHWEHANAQQRQAIMRGHFADWDDASRGQFLDGIIQNFRLLFIAAIARAK